MTWRRCRAFGLTDADLQDFKERSMLTDKDWFFPTPAAEECVLSIFVFCSLYSSMTTKDGHWFCQTA